MIGLVDGHFFHQHQRGMLACQRIQLLAFFLCCCQFNFLPPERTHRDFKCDEKNRIIAISNVKLIKWAGDFFINLCDALEDPTELLIPFDFCAIYFECIDVFGRIIKKGDEYGRLLGFVDKLYLYFVVAFLVDIPSGGVWRGICSHDYFKEKCGKQKQYD